jgi:peroxiredoxin
VLEAGDRVPDVQVWTAPREEARALKEVLGAGLTLLCFYVYDWSPG